MGYHSYSSHRLTGLVAHSGIVRISAGCDSDFPLSLGTGILPFHLSEVQTPPRVKLPTARDYY